MNKLNKIIIPFTVFMFLASFAFARDSIELKREISELTAKKAKIEQDLVTEKEKLNDVSERIKTTKELQKKSYSILREFGLQKLLKNAQILTLEISKIDSKKATIEQDLKRNRELLFLRYNGEIENLLDVVKNDSTRKSTLLIKLRNILNERSLLSAYLSPVYRESVDSFYVDPMDSYEDVLAKAGILDDYKVRLKKELTTLEGKLGTLKRQSFALNEISHLLEEENFFTETGFLKSVDKSDLGKNGKDSLAAKTNENNEDNQMETAEEIEGSDIPQQQTDTETADTALNGSSIQDDSMQADQNLQDAVKNDQISREQLDAHFDSTSKILFSKTRISKGNLQHQIKVLETERSNLIKLISEIENKRGSMEKEARRLHILKMK